MRFTNRWRIPVIFMVSGGGLANRSLRRRPRFLAEATEPVFAGLSVDGPLDLRGHLADLRRARAAIALDRIAVRLEAPGGQAGGLARLDNRPITSS